MKQKKYQITEEEQIHSILSRCTIGRLATLDINGYPYITPVNYVFFRGHIYFHCARQGEKTDNIQANPKVCFEVDIPLAYLDSSYNPKTPVCHVTQYYQSVIIRGKAEMVGDISEKVAALNSLMASHEKQEDFSAVKEDTPGVSKCAVVRISIETISGKQNLAQNRSDEEKQNIANYLQSRNVPGDSEAAEQIRPRE